MNAEPRADQGQKPPLPAGRVAGFFRTPTECEHAVKGLAAAGIAASKIDMLSGEAGTQFLEGSSKDFFMGDGETEFIERGIVELRDGHCLLAVQAEDHDEAVRITSIATQFGGHSFSYFGTLISEKLTK